MCARPERAASTCRPSASGRAAAAHALCASHELSVDAPGQALLDRLEPSLELVEAALEPDDVRLAEHRRLHGVLRVLDERRERETSASPACGDSHAARRVAACRRRAVPPPRRARARRRRRRATRSSRRSARRSSAANMLRVVRGRRTVDVLLERRRPGATPCARTAPPSGAGSGSTSIGNQPRSGANGLSDERVVPSRQPDLGMAAVDDLPDRLVQRRRVVDRRERREADGHPLGERPVARARARRRAGTPPTVPYRGGTAASTSRSDAPARPPELVRVGVDDPVGSSTGSPRGAPCGSPTRPGAGPRPARG